MRKKKDGDSGRSKKKIDVRKKTPAPCSEPLWEDVDAGRDWAVVQLRALGKTRPFVDQPVMQTRKSCANASNFLIFASDSENQIYLFIFMNKTIFDYI